MSDLLARLENAYAILKNAGLADRRSGFGITRNEVKLRLREDPEAYGRGGCNAGLKEATKGAWLAYVSTQCEDHDDPAEAVRLVEAECIRVALNHVRSMKGDYEKRIADGAAALAAIEALLPKERT